MEQRHTRHRNVSKKNNPALNDFSVDPTGSLDTGLPQRNQSAPNTSSGHLNLSIFGRPSTGFAERPESSGIREIVRYADRCGSSRPYLYDFFPLLGFPLDLPIAASEWRCWFECWSERTAPKRMKTNVPKSLPDFLNDGPIHNRTTAATDPGPISNSVESLERRV